MSQAATTTPACVTHPLSTTEVNFSSNLPKFDPALGTFRSATVTAAGSLETAVTLTNTSAQDQTAGAESRSTLITTGPDGPEPDLQVDVLIEIPLTIIKPNETLSFGPTTSSSNASKVSTDAERWVGTGTVNYSTVSVSSLTVIGGGGNIASTQRTRAGFEACVIFAYDLVATTTTTTTTTTTVLPTTTTITVAPTTPPPTTPPGGLPETGGGAGGLAAVGAALIIGGAGLIKITRRRLPLDSPP